jgi:hypothetical protein
MSKRFDTGPAGGGDEHRSEAEGVEQPVPRWDGACAVERVQRTEWSEFEFAWPTARVM